MAPDSNAQPPILQYSGPGGGASCPNCGSTAKKPVTFTWWGGLLGPKMLNHVKCLGCGTAFNGKTGKSNNTAIAIYAGVGLGIGLVGFVLFLIYG
jgi:hypothetical protein